MKQIKYFKVLIFAILILCLNGCGNDAHLDKGVVEEPEYLETVVQQEKPMQKNEKKSNSSGFSTFIAVVSLLISGYCLYDVKSENNKRKLMARRQQHHLHTHSNNYNDGTYERIIGSIKESDKNMSKMNADIAKLKEEINALKTKNAVRTSLSSDYSSQQKERSMQVPRNSTSYNAGQLTFKDVVEEYNYYINTDMELNAKFEKLNFQAKNNELFPKEDGEALLYIISDDILDTSSDKIFYVFPSKRIRERRVQGFVCDAFEIIGDGNKVRVSTPCSVRKMSTKYEIIKKGKVYLE